MHRQRARRTANSMTFTRASGRREPLLIALSLVLGLAYLFHGGVFTLPYPGGVLLKASGILALAVYAALARHRLVAAALTFSAIGDVMLALEPAQLTYGIAAFAVAHLLYGWLFLGVIRHSGSRGAAGLVLAVAVAAAGIAMLVWLQPDMGDLRVPATAYNAIIITMAVLALMSRSPWIAVIGALLFVLSDSLIALGLFKGIDPAWRGPAVWITYVAAQICLTIGLTRKN